jgi:hypothetical protein
MFDLSGARHLDYWKQLQHCNTRLVRPTSTRSISGSALYAAALVNGAQLLHRTSTANRHWPNCISPPHPSPITPIPPSSSPAAGVYIIAGEDGVCCYDPSTASSAAPLSSPWRVPPQRVLSRGVGPVSAALCLDALHNYTSSAVAVGHGDGQVLAAAVALLRWIVTAARAAGLALRRQPQLLHLLHRLQRAGQWYRRYPSPHLLQNPNLVIISQHRCSIRVVCAWRSCGVCRWRRVPPQRRMREPKIVI